MTDINGGCCLPSFAQVKVMHIMNVFDELMADLKHNPAHMIEAYQQIQIHCQRASVLFSCPALIASYTSHAPKYEKNGISDSFRLPLDCGSLPANPQRAGKQFASSDFRNEFRTTKILNENSTAETEDLNNHDVAPHRKDPVSSFMAENSKKTLTFPSSSEGQNVINSNVPLFRSRSALPLSHSISQCQKDEENVYIDAPIESQADYISFFPSRKKTHLDTEKGEDIEKVLLPISDKKSSLLDAGKGVKDTEYKRIPFVRRGSLTNAGLVTGKEANRTYFSSHRNASSNSAEGISRCERCEILSTLHASPIPVVRGSSKYEGFWIVVWPCFGTTASSFSQAGKRVFVRARYRLIVDVTEEVAKELHCQPPATVLYEPDGKEIQSIKHLRPEGHYLLFPSGGFYRRSAVPEALLRALLLSAKMACSL